MIPFWKVGEKFAVLGQRVQEKTALLFLLPACLAADGLGVFVRMENEVEKGDLERQFRLHFRRRA